MARKKANPDEHVNNDVEVNDMGEQATDVNEVADSKSTEDIDALEALLDAEDEAGQDEDFLEPELADDSDEDEMYNMGDEVESADDALTVAYDGVVNNDVMAAVDTIMNKTEDVIPDNEVEPVMQDEQRGTPIRASSERRIISRDGHLQIETQDDRDREALIDLSESRSVRKILTDTINGVEYMEGTDDVVAVLNHGKYSVYIPASEVIDIPEIPDFQPNTIKRLMLRKLLGAKIDYIVHAISEDGEFAVASRKDAMKQQSYEFFIRTRAGNNVMVYEDAVVEAYVMRATRNSVLLDVFGVETWVNNGELSYRRIADARDHFTSGQPVLVKILKINTSKVKDGGKVEIAVSIKQSAPDPAVAVAKKYTVGNLYVGTVTNVVRRGVFVALDGIDCLCAFPTRGIRPVRGSKVTVRVQQNRNGRLFGRITHVSGAPAPKGAR